MMRPVMGDSSSVSPGKNKAIAAVERFKETASLVSERLGRLKSGEDVAKPEEAVARLSYLAHLLLSTADEALVAKHTLMREQEQASSDEVGRLSVACTAAGEATRAAEAERDAATEQLKVLLAKTRKEQVTSRQRAAKDASRIQDLSREVEQLSSTLKVAEAAWTEERRADHAASSQRERNLNAAVVRSTLPISPHTSPYLLVSPPTCNLY